MRPFLLALLAAPWITCVAVAQNRAHFADVELVGPLSNVVLEVGNQGRTRIEGELAAGETRHVSVPVALVSAASKPAPLVRFDDQSLLLSAPGRVRFLAWRLGPSPLEALSSGLRARARPALEETSVAVSRAAPIVLVIALCLALVLRRKPVLGLVAAVCACAATYPLVSAPTRDTSAAVTLLDGDAEASAWRRVDAAFDEIVVPTGVDEFELWTEPSDVPVTWYAPLDPREPWRARAHGARLFLASVFQAGEGRLARARNALAAFDSTWLREDGAWEARGAWGADAALPAAHEPGSPPGWLASNLPQGVSMLIARASGGSARSTRWVRQSRL